MNTNGTKGEDPNEHRSTARYDLICRRLNFKWASEQNALPLTRSSTNLSCGRIRETSRGSLSLEWRHSPVFTECLLVDMASGSLGALILACLMPSHSFAPLRLEARAPLS